MLRSLLFALLIMLSAVAAAAPELSFNDVTTGETHRLSDYRGKWVVVNYWATWCPPCLEELPELVHFHESHRNDDAVVIGINMETLPQAKLAAFVEQNFITYPIAGNGSNEKMLGPVPGLPTTYLLSPEGKLVARQVGPITSDELEKFITDQGGQSAGGAD